MLRFCISYLIIYIICYTPRSTVAPLTSASTSFIRFIISLISCCALATLSVAPPFSSLEASTIFSVSFFCSSLSSFSASSLASSSCFFSSAASVSVTAVTMFYFYFGRQNKILYGAEVIFPFIFLFRHPSEPLFLYTSVIFSFISRNTSTMKGSKS